MYKNKKTGVIAEIIGGDKEVYILEDKANDMQYEVAKKTFKKEWVEVRDDGDTAKADPVPTATEEEQIGNVETAKQKIMDLFDKVNAAFFADRLPALSGVEVGLAPTPFKQYDYLADENKIVIGGQYLNGSLKDVAVLVFHMAIHDNCAINGIAATCQNGRYHNRVFQKMAESMGFTVEMTRSIGYGILIPGEDFGERLGFTAEEMEAPFMETPFMVVKTAKTPVTREAKPPFKQFKCPGCGMIAKAREGANLMCGDCVTALETVE